MCTWFLPKCYKKALKQGRDARVDLTTTEVCVAVESGVALQAGRGVPISRKLSPLTRAIDAKSAGDPSHRVGMDDCRVSVLLQTLTSGDWSSSGTEGGRRLHRADNAQQETIANSKQIFIRRRS